MKDMIHIVNNETVTVKLSRADVCRICVACLTIAHILDREGKHEAAQHWKDRRDRIAIQRDSHDEKAKTKGWR